SLKFYRNNASKNASESQMVLPESIKLMPLLLSCLMKNSVFFSTDYLSTRKIISMSIERNLRKFYPRIFSLSEYFLENKIIMIQNSLANIQNNEVYVIDDGSIITLYIGREVEIEENELLIGEEGETVKELLQVMKNEYDLEITFRVVRQGKGDYEVLGAMVEDKMNNVGAYNEFLCEMHFLVKDF
ncbi:Protein transport protein Sec24C, partial [Conglomerata obtusa]